MMIQTWSTGRSKFCERKLCVILVSTLLLFCSLVVPVTAAEEDPAYDAAQGFMELLDGGSFTQAWWEGSELLHLTSELDIWVKKQRIIREIMGKLEERTIKNVVQRASVSGLPDGDYRIFVVSSRFERKARGYEVLVLAKGPYGTWRVVSYNLR